MDAYALPFNSRVFDESETALKYFPSTVSRPIQQVPDCERTAA